MNYTRKCYIIYHLASDMLLAHILPASAASCCTSWQNMNVQLHKFAAKLFYL